MIADASLIKPLRALMQPFIRSTQIGITLIADESHYPVDRLMDGLAADIVITGNQQAHADLDQMGLTDRFHSRALAYDPLVLVAADNAPWLESLRAKTFSEHFLAGSAPVFVLLDAAYFPAMDSVSEIIDASDFDPKPKRTRVRSIDALQQALQKPGHYSVMPASVARTLPMLRVASVLQQPSQRITLRGEVLAGPRMKDARAVLEYLSSKKAAALWRNYGFVVEE